MKLYFVFRLFKNVISWYLLPGYIKNISSVNLKLLYEVPSKNRVNVFSFKMVHMKMLAYAGGQIVPMAQPFSLQIVLQLNTNYRKVVINFVATFLLGKFSKDVLTALIRSELGIFVC